MPRFSARVHLLGLIAAAVVPVWLFVTYLLIQYALTERERFEHDAVQVARQAALVTEGELDNLLTVVEALSKSPSMTAGDLAAVHAEARRLVDRTDRAVMLRTLDGRVLFDTRAAFDTELPQLPLSASEIERAKAGQRLVSGVYQSPLSNDYRVAVMVPVRGVGGNESLLAISVPTDRLRDVMIPATPDGWTTAIGDGEGRYVARSQMHAETTGKPGLPEYVSKVVGNAGTFTAPNFQGVTLLAGYYRSDFSGWFYAANIPLSVVQAPLWNSLKAIGATGLVAMLLSVALAYVVGTRMADAAGALAMRAEALGAGRPVPSISSSIREFAAIADAMVAADKSLSDRSNELQAVLETVPVAVWFTYDPRGRQVVRNRFAAEMMGLAQDGRAHFGTPDLVIDTIAIHDGHEVSRDDRPLTRAMRNEVTDNEEFEYIIPSGPRRVLLVSARPIHDPRGTVIGAVQVALDITERKRSEEHRRLLVKELNHRVKNTLAVVQSIATQTLRGADSLPEASTALIGRLISLAKAHDILTEENWSGADMIDVVAATLGAHADLARFEISGKSVLLAPSLALSLSMAFHELTTNAIKYGALSNGTGTVSLSWFVDENDGGRNLHVEWRERGGPPVVPTEHRGFGSRMLKRVLSTEPGGKVEIRMEPGGLICLFETSLARTAETA